jgi:alpha-L-fucosidase
MISTVKKEIQPESTSFLAFFASLRDIKSKKQMKKTLLFFLSALFFLQTAVAQESKESRDKRMQWWREARFGMFIHWGPYAVFGGVYHGHQQKRGGAEWIMNRCKIPVAEYQQVASTFNPVKYDPQSWVKLAKEAGMKYIVITAKHHDGFAMFKSGASKFNIADFTPYRKDVLEALAKACKDQDMKLGFYYSQAQDWNNPGGAVARKVASEGWDNPDSARIDASPQPTRATGIRPSSRPPWMNTWKESPFPR